MACDSESVIKLVIVGLLQSEPWSERREDGKHVPAFIGVVKAAYVVRAVLVADL